MPSARFRNGYRPTSSILGVCPLCGEQTVTRYGQTTHTPNGRGDLWQGTLVELISCHPSKIREDATS